MNAGFKGFAVVAGLSVGLLGAFAADDPKAGHARMKTEHAKVHDEHDVLLKKIAKWRVEHLRSVAALREIEASILEHEAELQELAEHAREHEDHIHHHDEEIADHEKGGDGKDHADLAEAHTKLLKEHADVIKRVEDFGDDHENLVKSLAKLRETLKAH